MKNILASIILLASAAVATAAPQAYTAKDTITDSRIVPPESFDTDIQALHANYYLQRYAVLDSMSRSYSRTTPSDAVYIERLSKLPTVIEMPYNQVVRNYIELYAVRRPELVERMLGVSLYYMPIFEAALERHGMPLELKYLPVIESALNPNATSRVGAGGLWQFMPATAKDEGLEVNSLVDQRRDPYASSEAAARFLKKLYGIFNDWSLAIAAYNCGPGNVTKALKRAGGSNKDFWEIYPFLPAETRGYVPAFIAANYIMTYYGEHGISPALARKPVVVDTVHVNKRVHFQQIADVLGVSMDEIRTFNPQYRQDIIPGNIRPYSLALPSVQAYCYVANEDTIIAHDAAKYAQRGVVEPADGSRISGEDSRGQYIEELTYQTHVVKKNETLKTIAKRYGVTTSAIKSANGLKGNTVKRGARLKIPVYKRRYVEKKAAPAPATTPTTPTTPDAPVVQGDSIPNDSIAPEVEHPVEEPAEEPAAVQTPAPQPERTMHKPETRESTITHKVKAGETLTKIAGKYGVTIAQIKQWNNLRTETIQVGQNLKIKVKVKNAPASTSKKKAASKKKTSSRRR